MPNLTDMLAAPADPFPLEGAPIRKAEPPKKKVDPIADFNSGNKPLPTGRAEGFTLPPPLPGSRREKNEAEAAKSSSLPKHQSALVDVQIDFNGFGADDIGLAAKNRKAMRNTKFVVGDLVLSPDLRLFRVFEQATTDPGWYGICDGSGEVRLHVASFWPSLYDSAEPVPAMTHSTRNPRIYPAGRGTVDYEHFLKFQREPWDERAGDVRGHDEQMEMFNGQEWRPIFPERFQPLHQITEPEPKFKVGDLVKCEGKLCRVSTPMNKAGFYELADGGCRSVGFFTERYLSAWEPPTTRPATFVAEDKPLKVSAEDMSTAIHDAAHRSSDLGKFVHEVTQQWGSLDEALQDESKRPAMLAWFKAYQQ